MPLSPIRQFLWLIILCVRKHLSKRLRLPQWISFARALLNKAVIVWSCSAANNGGRPKRPDREDFQGLSDQYNDDHMSAGYICASQASFGHLPSLTFNGTTPAININMPTPIEPIGQSAWDVQRDMPARKTSKPRVGRKIKSSASLRSNKSNLTSPRLTRPAHASRSPTRELLTLRSQSPTAGVAAASRASSPRRVANTSSHGTWASMKPQRGLLDGSEKTRGRSPRPANVSWEMEKSGSLSGGASHGLADDDIFPMFTDHVRYQRYEQAPKIERTQSKVSIPPMTRRLPRPEALGAWEACTHPDGALYFFHETSRTYTTVDISKEDLFQEINKFLRIIERAKMRIMNAISEEVECVLHVDSQLSEHGRSLYKCYYYLVDNINRVIFWMDDFDAESTENMFDDVDSVTDLAHAQLKLESQYWAHWELFPDRRIVPDGIINEITGALVHAGYDALSSKSSISPFSAEECQQHMGFVKNLEGIGHVGGYAACVVGRMMNILMQERFRNFAGQPCARLRRNQAIYIRAEDEYNVSHPMLHKIVSLLLFYAPDVYSAMLKQVWVDEMINQVPWRAYVIKLNEEWREFVLLGTVLLSANGALLAVPDVDSTPIVNRNAVQILSYASITASIGSVVIGLLLIRQYRTNPREFACDAATYLDRKKHPQLGIETLAILYALPYAGLMWAMVTFLAALSVLFYNKTSLTTRIVCAIVEAVVTTFLIWCVWDSWIEDQGWLQGIITRSILHRGSEPDGRAQEATSADPTVSDNAPRRDNILSRLGAWRWIGRNTDSEAASATQNIQNEEV